MTTTKIPLIGKLVDKYQSRKFYKKLHEESERFKRAEENAKTELLSNNSFIVDIEKIDERKFYDTTWLVTTLNGSVKVVRYDDETYANFCSALSCVQTMEEIKALDERNSIYYD